MIDVFISYSRRDIEFAQWLEEGLKEHGYETWRDEEEIRGGTSWLESLEHAIADARVIVVIISPAANESVWVRREVLYGQQRNIPILPIQPAICELPLSLLDKQAIDFTSRQKGLARLIKDLQQLLPDHSAVPPGPVGIEVLLPAPFEWISVPAGQVTLLNAGFTGNEEPEIHSIPAFDIAKYPVTNAQYATFIETNDGYCNQAWWDYSELARQWRANHQEPADLAYSGDMLPRTNVTWYEGIAFCRWLSSHTDRSVSLPTEPQWQRAAQGDDQRLYPWGDEFNSKLCNFNNIRPTSVTRFDKSASPYGVADMVGNAAEWCLTLSGESGIDLNGDRAQALRGNTFRASNPRHLRVTTRDYDVPSRRDRTWGFRLASSGNRQNRE